MRRTTVQWIRKGPEPQELAELRREHKRIEQETAQPPVPNDWSNRGKHQTTAMRRALYDEQHGLCAYCQQSLTSPEFDGRGAFTIEHVVARSTNVDLMFEWTNLIAVCPGQSGTVEHCDTRRGNDHLDIDPCRPEIEQHVGVGSPKIDPTSGVRILPLVGANTSLHAQLERTLGLNELVLGSNRLQIRDLFRTKLQALVKQKKSSEAHRLLKRRLESATTTVPGANRPPYARVISDYCNRKLRQWSR